MERRDFLRAGTLAGAAPLIIPSGAVAAPGWPGKVPDERMTAAEMDAFLARLDHGMARVSAQADALAAPRHPTRPLTAADLDDEQRAKRHIATSMRSLTLAGSMRDLPLHGQVHPGMQRRLWDGMPEMDAAIDGTKDLIAGLSPADHLDFGKLARKDPQFGMKVIEYVDGQAEIAGVSARRRLHLRQLASHIAWRMKHQSPSAVMDEFAGRVEKMQARAGGWEDLRRRMAATMGEAAFWDLQERAGVLAASWQEDPGMPPPPAGGTGGGAMWVPSYGTQPAPAPPQPVPAQPRPGQKLVTAGAICLGLGVVISVTGVIVAVTGQGVAGAIIITPGAILIIIGVILLAVGAVRNSRAG